MLCTKFDRIYISYSGVEGKNVRGEQTDDNGWSEEKNT